MTTAQIPQSKQSQALADAITKAIEVGDLEAQRPLQGLRVCALPDNSRTVADVSWAEHPVVAKALRRAAKLIRSEQPEGTESPVAAQLDDVAGQLDNQLRQRQVNGGGVKPTS